MYFPSAHRKCRASCISYGLCAEGGLALLTHGRVTTAFLEVLALFKKKNVGNALHCDKFVMPPGCVKRPLGKTSGRVPSYHAAVSFIKLT